MGTSELQQETKALHKIKPSLHTATKLVVPVDADTETAQPERAFRKAPERARAMLFLAQLFLLPP